jgi:hypothetical protein
MMATFLTYLDNRIFAASGSAPDENYAREIMQLFSIGLYKLNMDGTTQVVPGSANGEPEQTHDSDDIVTFARAWTGFTLQPFRGNLKARAGAGSSNFVDPLQIKAQRRDVMPKMNLDDGYLGDQYPLCTHLPVRQFLRKGARYRYLGANNANPVGMAEETSISADSTDVARLVLTSASSQLYAPLCGAAAPGGPCTFPVDIEIRHNMDDCGVGLPGEENQPRECAVDAMRMILVVDGSSGTSAGAVAWYV